jgi:hypothetical protein
MSRTNRRGGPTSPAPPVLKRHPVRVCVCFALPTLPALPTMPALPTLSDLWHPSCFTHRLKLWHPSCFKFLKKKKPPPGANPLGQQRMRAFFFPVAALSALPALPALPALSALPTLSALPDCARPFFCGCCGLLFFFTFELSSPPRGAVLRLTPF